jgi:hypothetical protein
MDQPQPARIAVCGLDCSTCNLFAAKNDQQAAETLVAWFRQERWLKPQEGAQEIMARGPYCLGCHGDRSVQWSGDCWIRKCCVEEKQRKFCSECPEFPCTRLTAWSQSNGRYAAAFERLRSMRLGQGGECANHP